MTRHLREPAGALERPGHEVVGECCHLACELCVCEDAWREWDCGVAMLYELGKIPSLGNPGYLKKTKHTVTQQPSSRVGAYRDCSTGVLMIDAKTRAPGSHPELFLANLSPAVPAGDRD